MKIPDLNEYYGSVSSVYLSSYFYLLINWWELDIEYIHKAQREEGWWDFKGTNNSSHSSSLKRQDPLPERRAGGVYGNIITSHVTAMWDTTWEIQQGPRNRYHHLWTPDQNHRQRPQGGGQRSSEDVHRTLGKLSSHIYILYVLHVLIAAHESVHFHTVGWSLVWVQVCRKLWLPQNCGTRCQGLQDSRYQKRKRLFSSDTNEGTVVDIIFHS